MKGLDTELHIATTTLKSLELSESKVVSSLYQKKSKVEVQRFDSSQLKKCENSLQSCACVFINFNGMKILLDRSKCIQ